MPHRRRNNNLPEGAGDFVPLKLKRYFRGFPHRQTVALHLVMRNLNVRSRACFAIRAPSPAPCRFYSTPIAAIFDEGGRLDS